MYYLTLIYRDSEGGWGFTVPDVPGFTAISDRPALGEALAEAREVLTAHLTAMIDNGMDLPAARDPGDIIADPDLQEDIGGAAASILLPAMVAGGRTLRVNLSLDEWTLGLIDTAARDRGLTRSAFIAEACRRAAVGEVRAPAAAEASVEAQRRLHEAMTAGTAAPKAAKRTGSIARDPVTGQMVVRRR